jgi:RNA polymerase-binding transcription factor DksA
MSPANTTTSIRSRLEGERERLLRIRSSLAGEAEEAVGDELSSIDQHPANGATTTFEQAKDVSILRQVGSELADVDRALARLEAQDYGRCEACGRPIDEERLAARPAARFCLDDQAAAERGMTREGAP